MPTPLTTDLPTLHLRIAGLLGRLEQAAAALPAAWAAHRDGVPRELVDLIQDEIRTSRIPRSYPEDALPEDYQAFVVVTASCAVEHGDAPPWAAFELSRAYLRQIRQLQWVCQTTGCAEVTVMGSPEYWGCREDDDNDVRTSWSRLVVDGDGFYFACEEKYSGLLYETAYVDTTRLVELLLAEPEAEALGYDEGHNWVDDFEEQLEDEDEDSDDDTAIAEPTTSAAPG
jgi:hypothetical protein